MSNWLLPEYIADALPQEAIRIDQLRRSALDLFRVHGYELVIPPLLEHLDSLLTGSGSDLKLRTFNLIDQLSGRTLGLRADMTPQVTRIDAHLLNRAGTVRLCYCGSVLHTLPASLASSREPIQLGAEFYGYKGIEADIEIIRLMALALKMAGTPASCIDISHVGVFLALIRAAGLDAEAEANILSFLQIKDVSSLRDSCVNISEPYRSAFLRLPELYGDISRISSASSDLPDLPEISLALKTMRHLHEAMPELPLSFDLADLRGYNYHNGIVFAAYYPEFPSAIALGGRYDGAGEFFGRFRPATGFSMDLREIARLTKKQAPRRIILSPYCGNNASLASKIADLRGRGEIVVELLPGETECDGLEFNRRLVEHNDQWFVQAISQGNTD